jgi:hypothetical protein
MKQMHILLLAAMWLLHTPSRAENIPETPIDSLQIWLNAWNIVAETDFQQLNRDHLEKREPLHNRLFEVKTALSNPCNRTPAIGFDLLWEKSQLEETLAVIDDEAMLKLTKLRYRKSIDILKTLYEKVLSMDHHFSSLKAQQSIAKMSNPHEYPEFKEMREQMGERMKKKAGFELPALLQANPYVSAAYTIVGFVVSGLDKEKKPAEMDKISCILDFTVKMHADLNIIYYETGYLREANFSLKQELESLFIENARQVGYTIPLENCRDSDDWERLFGLLDIMVNKSMPQNGVPPDPNQLRKLETNLQFAIDRTVRFIDKYATFVSQGGDYYKKFEKIASGYDNAVLCSTVLPEQFKQLKVDIHASLDKFNTAYRIPEMEGSRLKDLLYGINEN